MTALLLLTLVSLVGLPGQPAAEPEAAAVRYRVDLSNRAQQIVKIEADIPAVDGVAEVVLPVWRPGRYGVLDFAAHVREWSAADAAGRPLPTQKVRKDVWRIEADGDDDTVTFAYEIYANDLGTRTRHVDDTHAFLSGSSIFVLSPPHRDELHLVSLDLPDGWKIASGLDQEGSDLFADSYDVLMDSPIEAGHFASHRFDAHGVDTEVAIWGDVDPDWQAIERDFSAIADVQLQVFGGDVHFDRYVYIIHAYPGGRGGTEHLNSTVCQTTPATFQDESRYHGFLGLIAHEYFHTWNVKRFRPAGLVPYGFNEENYTSMLWLVEGTTSYYDDLTLVRAGITPRDEYFDRIGSSTTSVEDRPGARRSSLSDSSFDAWLKFWGPSSPDHRNTSVNFYTHGAMVSLCLDLLLRDSTDGERSLDDVMRELADRFDWTEGNGYTPSDVRAIVSDIAGRDMGWFFDRHIDGTEPPPIRAALAHAGVLIERTTADDELLFGASTTREGVGLRVTRLAEGSPAFAAGINVDDVLTSIDGWSLADRSISDALGYFELGDEVAVSLARRGRQRDIIVTLDTPQPGGFEVREVDEPSERQLRIRDGWLGGS
ncbi:MAG: PDZ domain-containing protein [Planctomycetota bacterium]